ncbi:MAG: protein-L-isoaspartate(D-aspartate) O-methyltransferase [Bacteroidetes bacterium]|nr:protein-L-isoaspartate(D-aspartate) O-methyltransferase [Bacteroidota bacterium]
MKYGDSYIHKGMRKKLVDQVRSKGIEDESVLDAINRVPRHYFLDKTFVQFSYEDKAFPIGEGQTISQPFTVAYQTQLLEAKKGDKVLEIGTGSGYQACVLADMGIKVFSIERQKKLFDKTKAFLPKIGYHHIKCFFGDGYKGLMAFAPFDAILVTAAARDIPEALIKQLKVGGRLVIPVGSKKTQRMVRFTKREDEVIKEEFEWFSFVPMLEGKKF